MGPEDNHLLKYYEGKILRERESSLLYTLETRNYKTSKLIG